MSEAPATQARQASYRGPMDIHIEFADYSSFLEDDPIPFPAVPAWYSSAFSSATRGLAVMLDAWPVVLAQVPRAELVIAGDGPMGAAVAGAWTSSGYPEA